VASIETPSSPSSASNDPEYAFSHQSENDEHEGSSRLYSTYQRSYSDYVQPTSSTRTHGNSTSSYTQAYANAVSNPQDVRAQNNASSSYQQSSPTSAQAAQQAYSQRTAALGSQQAAAAGPIALTRQNFSTGYDNELAKLNNGTLPTIQNRNLLTVEDYKRVKTASIPEFFKPGRVGHATYIYAKFELSRIL
jgi:hypothetical protein